MELEITFCKELQDDLLKGATIIWKSRYSVLCTILVRLPKGEFEKVTDGIEFEYKQYQQEEGEKMYHATYRNGTKREAIKRTDEDHSETSFCIRSARKTKEATK